MCALWGGDTDERRRAYAGAQKSSAGQHRADVILSKGCAEPTARAIIQTPCSGVHLHNFMALHGRSFLALAPRPRLASVSRAEIIGGRCCLVSPERARNARRRVEREKERVKRWPRESRDRS